MLVITLRFNMTGGERRETGHGRREKGDQRPETGDGLHVVATNTTFNHTVNIFDGRSYNIRSNACVHIRIGILLDFTHKSSSVVMWFILVLLRSLYMRLFGFLLRPVPAPYARVVPRHRKPLFSIINRGPIFNIHIWQWFVCFPFRSRPHLTADTLSASTSS